MKIVADDQIPLIDELFGQDTVVKKPGQQIQRADLVDADVLLVRTVTSVNADLLTQTSVRWVGAATAGYDHLDTAWLDEQGIAWAYAPGANAQAVLEYVLCVIAALRAQGYLRSGLLRAGVIGVGRVGRLVASYLEKMGFEVMLNDPPRAVRDETFHSTPLSEFADLDLLCLHPALIRHGLYPSYHLLNDDFWRRQKPGMVLLNAARGEIVATDVLLRQTHLRLCLDVWENEPSISLDLLRAAVIATPHIAAYSVQAKRQASLLLYHQLQAWAGGGHAAPLPEMAALGDLFDGWESRALSVFNPLSLTQQMRQLLLAPAAAAAQEFLRLRQEYPWRENYFPSFKKNNKGWTK
jgi:erythronate-4-phosphate dehydrogenase